MTRLVLATMMVLWMMAACLPAAQTPEPDDPETIDVLWIGSEWLADGLIEMQTRLMIEYNGEDSVFRMQRITGPENTIAAGEMPSDLKLFFARHSFDIIIVQAFDEALIEDADKFFENARQWHETLLATKAEIVLFYPWIPLGTNATYQERIDESVHQAAWSQRWILAPVGPVFQDVSDALLFAENGEQISAQGTYLSAAVMLNVLTGVQAKGVPVFTSFNQMRADEIVSLEPEIVTVLQAAADRNMANYRQQAEFLVQVSLEP